MSSETKFSVMVSLFEWIQKSKQSAKKRSKFRKFLDTFCSPHDYFSSVRLLLPTLDRERGSYGLKESILATSLVDALGISRDSPDALRLFNWRKGGPKTGANAGNFALVATEVLQCRQGEASGGLTIKELNDLLDRLASSENRAEKISVLSSLIKKTNAHEMKWIIMIILKDLKLGISEKAIFHEFHPDAEDLFNVTCDLKLVCEKLRDRSQRHKRQDIEVGKAVRPQLAKRVIDAHVAWKKLHGKEVVVECKFDGDRIQVHKNGTEVHYFSRCILDGEMLVWDNSLSRFAEFGSNQEIAKAAKDGLDSDRQLCYVAFDILFVGDTSVIHQSLKERQELLRKVVEPLRGHLEILVPKGGGLNSHRLPGEPSWSLLAHNVDDVERFYKETIENRDEGVVIKDLGSKWEPGDRSGKWMKLKPDYVRTGSDLDVLIIGGYHGSGRRGGEVAQFLVGLAERPAPNTYPRRFISFCRVGTGLSDDELDAVVTKLKPYFRKYEYPKKAPPSFYQVTNNSKERPDVWIESPEQSIILSITSDIRTIRSEVFAAPYSLRFPRIDRVRYDKPWHECLDVQSFVDLVHSSNGTTQKGKQHDEVGGSKPTRTKSSKRGEKKNASLVPSHLIQTDVSNVKGQSLIFSNMMFYFVNVPPTHSLESLHKMVAENGGTFAMNLNSSVTHCIAAQSKGIKYQAAKLQGDVIHYSWVLDCCTQKKLLPLQPKYFLFISNSSKKKLQEEIDEFSDPYYWNIDLADIKQLLNDIKLQANATASTTDDFRKYCPDDKWCRFNGCCIYFCPLIPSLMPDWEILLGITLRRLKLEVLMAGGKVSHDLAQTTHLVVLTIPGSDVDFDFLLGSFTAAEKHLLQKKRLNLIRSEWLEDSLERGKKLPEDAYSLKPTGFESILKDSEQDIDSNQAMSRLDDEGVQKISRASKATGGKAALESSTIPDTSCRGAKRKKGLATVSMKKGKIGASQVPRMRMRAHVAKICEEESEGSSSCDEMNQEGFKIGKKGHDINKGIVTKDVREPGMLEDSESLHRGPDINKVHDVERIKMKEKQEDLIARAHDIQMDETHHCEEDERPEKLEVMVDPVQAMLMDMIPSLGMKKTETINPIPDEEKKPDVDPEGQPSKKKKVSYKDLADELLKDW